MNCEYWDNETNRCDVIWNKWGLTQGQCNGISMNCCVRVNPEASARTHSEPVDKDEKLQTLLKEVNLMGPYPTLHSHKNLIPHSDEEHILVDKKDWDLVHKILWELKLRDSSTGEAKDVSVSGEQKSSTVGEGQMDRVMLEDGRIFSLKKRIARYNSKTGKLLEMPYEYYMLGEMVSHRDLRLEEHPQEPQLDSVGKECYWRREKEPYNTDMFYTSCYECYEVPNGLLPKICPWCDGKVMIDVDEVGWQLSKTIDDWDKMTDEEKLEKVMAAQGPKPADSDVPEKEDCSLCTETNPGLPTCKEMEKSDKEVKCRFGNLPSECKYPVDMMCDFCEKSDTKGEKERMLKDRLYSLQDVWDWLHRCMEIKAEGFKKLGPYEKSFNRETFEDGFIKGMIAQLGNIGKISEEKPTDTKGDTGKGLQLGIIKAVCYKHYEHWGYCLHMTIESIYRHDGHSFIFGDLIPKDKLMERLDGIINTPYEEYFDDLIGMGCIIQKTDVDESKFISFYNKWFEDAPTTDPDTEEV